MPTAVAKKPRANAEAVAQISALPERVSVLETKVENISEKLVELKADVKEMHDCLDNTRDLLADKLEKCKKSIVLTATDILNTQTAYMLKML